MKTQFDNWGGHLLNPPSDCPHLKEMPDGNNWTDLGCCQRYHLSKKLNIPCPCSHFMWFTKASVKERQKYLLDNSIRLNIREEKPKTKYKRRKDNE